MSPVTCLCLSVDEGLISIYLQHALLCYIVATSFLETTSRKCAFAGNSFFQICYEYKVRRVNNILIIGQPVTLILDKYIQSHKL